MASEDTCKWCFNKMMMEGVKGPKLTAVMIKEWYKGLTNDSRLYDLMEVGPLIKVEGRVFHYAVITTGSDGAKGTDPVGDIRKMKIPGCDNKPFNNILKYCPDVKEPHHRCSFVY